MDYIQKEIDEASIVLFMKGTVKQPLCGFSRLVVQILQSLHVPFKEVDIFSHPSLREDLKVFSQWPTFPQLYIRGKFIGGCDIVKELYLSGELSSMCHFEESKECVLL